jgi:hypothetical protein
MHNLTLTVFGEHRVLRVIFHMQRLIISATQLAPI